MPKGIGKIFITAALGLGLLAWFCAADHPGEARPRPGFSTAELRALAEQGNALDQQLLARLRFRAVFTAVKDQVLRDSDLRAATEKIRRVAAAQYPVFLKNLRRAGLGSNDRERVARNLLNFFRLDLKDGGLSAESGPVLARLEDEFHSTSFRRWCAARRAKRKKRSAVG
jgi:hypothetical protein